MTLELHRRTLALIAQQTDPDATVTLNDDQAEFTITVTTAPADQDIEVIQIEAELDDYDLTPTSPTTLAIPVADLPDHAYDHLPP